MKKATNRILNYSLLGLLCASFGSGALAGIRVGSQNASYANSSKNKLGLQQQYQNYLAQQAQAAQEAQGLPVPVADVELAESIQNGTGTSEVNRDVLSRCAMIYPNGEFVWDKPTIGHMAGGPATCVAVVEMRVMGQGVSSDGKEYIAVARGKLAAGDIMKCDIDSFPQSTYLPDIVNINFPSDERPTREDVIKALNEEQKNKAGLKIGGAVLTGLIAGNVLGENDPGKNSPLGLSKSKLKSSLIGGLAAGGVMTASTMGGKVVGDVVLGTGVNAMAGALTGNMYDAISGGGEAL
ncbi:MAG: hypothetical protein K5912_04520, partial [Alphaproteobacteria bacterium]|nr:hypothetical protein [Alphaproteobacteria bacterium]